MRDINDIKIVKYHNIPCWYELSWRPVVGIVLRIHKDFASYANSKPIPKNSPILVSYKKNFRFKKFGEKFGEDLGFEGSIKFLGQSGEFLEYQIPMSLCRKLGEKCKRCKGTGKDEDAYESRCLYCGGEGKEVNYDYKEAYEVSASLTILLQLFLLFPDMETSSSLFQLISLETVTIRSAHGGSLSGEYSTEVVDFLRQRTPGDIPEMTAAMRAVHVKMEGGIRDYYKYSFSAYTQGSNGWLNVSCPGDACGLHPQDSSVSSSREGYGFSCHNVDQPIQQLTLIGAIAALHDLVRPHI